MKLHPLGEGRDVKSYTMVEYLRAYIDAQVKPKYSELEEI